MKRRTFLATTLAPAFLPAQEPEDVALYAVGSWPARYGNHRARLRVSGTPDRVQAYLPWRRHDDPEQKDILIVEAASEKQVEPVEVYNISSDSCHLAFRPPAAGEYHVYYMPYRAATIPHAWRTAYAPPRFKRAPKPAAELPKARLLDLQARTEFDRFDPMEVAATAAEMKELIRSQGDPPFLVFAEHRQHPVRMTRRIPVRWARAAPMHHLQGEAARGEFYVFQVAVFASRQDLSAVDLRAEGPFPFRCFNLGGRDWTGRPFRKSVRVPHGVIQTFWCGLEIPRDAAPGEASISVRVEAAGHRQDVKLNLRVAATVLDDGGDRDLWRLSRLRWLDSTVGIDDAPTAPYTPLAVKGDSVGCLNRTIRFGASGLPASIRSNELEILAAPMRLAIRPGPDEASQAATRTVSATAGSLERETRYRTGDFQVQCSSRTEFDG
ncbi:MAG: DUF6067 family protein, partial [Acidobacteria bacterium]|nr:DUF6067 family protein [Acidobacteriota bacterium]